jgi:pimeloyl-ACP methyl ester carboxylesterase
VLIDNAGVELNVIEDGDTAAPPVLLLHGITSCASTWDFLVPTLATRHRVLRLDFRGHGRSGRAPGRYQLADYVADAQAVCEQVVGRPCPIVGHSLGGGTAAAVAQRRPDLVTGVVLEDPALMAPTDTFDAHALAEGFGLMRQAVPMLQAQQMPIADLAALLTSMPLPQGGTIAEGLHPDAVLAMADGLLRVDITVLDPVVEGTMTTVFDPGAAIPVRGLVLAADPASPDAVMRQVDRDRLAAHSPLVEVRVVSGAGHLIHDSTAHRATFVEAVTQFLAGL